MCFRAAEGAGALSPVHKQKLFKPPFKRVKKLKNARGNINVNLDKCMCLTAAGYHICHIIIHMCHIIVHMCMCLMAAGYHICHIIIHI